jgi:hypothetical protein
MRLVLKRITASPECAGRPLRSTAGPNGAHRLLPAAGPRNAGWLRSLRPARATPTPPPHSTLGPSRLMSVPSPVLRPLPGQPPPHDANRWRGATTAQPAPGQISPDKNDQFPLRPPRLRDDPVDGDGLHLLEQAHPDRPAFYAVRVPRCRVSPRASFPPRLTTTQLPPARS